MTLPAAFSLLRDFFQKPVCTKGAGPLSAGTSIAIFIDSQGPFCLEKTSTGLLLQETQPKEPDMTFRVSEAGIQELCTLQTDNLGELGVAILKLMTHVDEGKRLKAKVHAGSFTLLRHGYFQVLALGGAPLMSFLATKGFGSINRIKEALSRLRG